MNLTFKFNIKVFNIYLMLKFLTFNIEDSLTIYLNLIKIYCFNILGLNIKNQSLHNILQ